MGTRWIVMALLASSLTWGCTRDEAVMFTLIGHSSASGSNCMVQTSPLTTMGKMDLALTSEYTLYPVVINQMEVPDDPTGVATNPSDILIQSADVELEIASNITTAVPTSFNVPATGYVPVTTTFGAAFVAIPRDIGERLRTDPQLLDHKIGLLIVHVRLRGRMLDETEVVTNWLEYPVSVCVGCLTYRIYEKVDDEVVEACSTKEIQETDLAEQCALGQDGLFPCNICYRVAPEALRSYCF